MDEDYLYYVEAASQHSDVWKNSRALKWDISQNREEWLKSGVIVEGGSGQERKRVLLSWTRYIQYLRKKAA